MEADRCKPLQCDAWSCLSELPTWSKNSDQRALEVTSGWPWVLQGQTLWPALYTDLQVLLELNPTEQDCDPSWNSSLERLQPYAEAGPLEMGPWLSSLEDILGSNWKVADPTSSYGTEKLFLGSEMFLIDPFLHAPPPCVLSPSHIPLAEQIWGKTHHCPITLSHHLSADICRMWWSLSALPGSSGWALGTRLTLTAETGSDLSSAPTLLELCVV